MPHRAGRRVVEVLAAAAIAAAIWAVAHRHYEKFLASVTSAVVTNATVTSARSTLAVTRPGTTESRVVAPLTLLSFQFVLLAALGPLMLRRPFQAVAIRVAIATAALVAVHVIALRLGVAAVLATSFGDWSEAHYGPFAMNLLFYLWQGYVVVGGYAIVFALAWLTFGSTPGRNARRR